MYKKFRNIPNFIDSPLICPYFLGFRVGRYGLVFNGLNISHFKINKK